MPQGENISPPCQAPSVAAIGCPVKRLVIFALLSLAACTAPCDQLADNICNCLSDLSSRAACKQQISAEDSTVKVSAADQKFCSTKLETCTCDRLNNGDREACGLTREPDAR